MKIVQETVRYLNVFCLSKEKLPKMKELRKRYFEPSLIRHPDKKTGTDAAIQELLNAYLAIANW